MIVAVTGLAREARLVAGPNVTTVVSGGNVASLERQLAGDLPEGARRILSIGICGALSPELRVGDIVIASEIVTKQESFLTDREWTQEIAHRLPRARVAALASSDAIVADRADKRRLHEETRAVAVDMESHVAARAARARGFPFAALRVVSDAAHRTLPPAARLALGPDGHADMKAVLRSVFSGPLQIPALIRTAWEAETAFAALLRCRRLLSTRLGVADLGELALDMR